MSNPHGSFIWYELLTADPAAAKAFYDHVVGWSIDAAPAPGGIDYRMIVALDGGGAGGVMTLSADMIASGARPVWLGYFGVDDVDAAVAAIVAEGGQVHLPAFDIPDVGRVAMVADPQGNAFYVMRGASDATSTAYRRDGIGHVSWNELFTADADAGLAFYARCLNLTVRETMPMGAMGDYSLIAPQGIAEPTGAVMRTPPGADSGWRFYFRVPDIDAARARVESAGGAVEQGPMEVPGGEWIVNARDPEGVAFSLVAPARS